MTKNFTAGMNWGDWMFVWEFAGMDEWVGWAFGVGDVQLVGSTVCIYL